MSDRRRYWQVGARDRNRTVSYCQCLPKDLIMLERTIRYNVGRKDVVKTLHRCVICGATLKGAEDFPHTDWQVRVRAILGDI